MFTFEELRKKYPTFVYRSYTVSDDGGNLKVTYEFALGDDIVFRPSWVFPYQKEKIESGKNAKPIFTSGREMDRKRPAITWAAISAPMVTIFFVLEFITYLRNQK